MSDDLISREQALNAVKWDTEAYTAINMLPSVDAVPVIRCKDCKYWNGEGKYCDYDMSGLRDDFCSWAERKEE